MVKVGSYDYKISNRKGKKLYTVVNGKEIHFGSDVNQHYNDKTGLLNKKLNHLDKDRQKKYLSRAKGIKDKNGNLTYKNPNSANYHAIKILW
jgi:aminopeptidase C